MKRVEVILSLPDITIVKHDLREIMLQGKNYFFMVAQDLLSSKTETLINGLAVFAFGVSFGDLLK